MRHTETVPTTKTIVTITCDVCQIPERRTQPCPGCGIDICSDCGTWWRFNPWDGTDYGDYQPIVCKPCNAKAHPFARQAAAILEEADQKIEALRKQWEEACKG